MALTGTPNLAFAELCGGGFVSELSIYKISASGHRMKWRVKSRGLDNWVPLPFTTPPPYGQFF